MVSIYSKERLVLHAPNIHQGGGLSLLNAVLNIKPFPFAWLQLDSRMSSHLKIPSGVTTCFIKKSIFARVYAEWRLKKISHKEDRVICLHGLPPLFSLPGKTIVVLQNCLLFQPQIIRTFPWKKRLRLSIERYWLLYFQKHATRFIVQTNSMAQLARTQLNSPTSITIFPFANTFLQEAAPQIKRLKNDFIYVASGEVHKNHLCLLDSWVLLAQEQIRPSLLLTVDPYFYPELSQKISLYREKFGLKIINLGRVTPEEIHRLYQNAKAMIYPSLGESLGLPLIEALSHKLPILAAEKDYIRDVVSPIETFEPTSSLSIARAIKRFLNINDPIAGIHSPQAFIMEVQS